MAEETKIKVYFDENRDDLIYSLRTKKRESQQEERGFYIPKDKLAWIKKAEEEYFKSQQYIRNKLIENDLI